MQHVKTAVSSNYSSVLDGTDIPPLLHQEAMTMCAEELQRFIGLIEALGEDDWQKQTACPLWTVQDIVAHQAAHIYGFTSYGRMFGQMNPRLLRPYFKKGMSFLDAWNQSQVDLRRDYTPEALIAEIRDSAEQSLKGRDRMFPAFVRGITMPMPGLDQARSPGYVFDLIYTRDMWMHRIDICNATGREMPMDDQHDKRMVALIMRDLAMKSRRALHGCSALLKLTGVAGGTYHIGGNGEPEASIEMDAVEFCILTSGREKAANILTGEHATLSGDVAFGRTVLNFSENRVLY